MSDQITEPTIPEDLKEAYAVTFEVTKIPVRYNSRFVRDCIERIGRAEAALRDVKEWINHKGQHTRLGIAGTVNAALATPAEVTR